MAIRAAISCGKHFTCDSTVEAVTGHVVRLRLLEATNPRDQHSDSTAADPIGIGTSVDVVFSGENGTSPMLRGRVKSTAAHGTSRLYGIEILDWDRLARYWRAHRV